MGPGADSEEKHEPVSDIDTALVDSLKALDPKRPIREADIVAAGRHVSNVPNSEVVHFVQLAENSWLCGPDCHEAPRGLP
jgi:hypothetical protein